MVARSIRHRALLVAAALVLLPAPAGAQADVTAMMFGRMDLDGDGAIDREELRALRLRIFGEMDEDRDASLTREEFVQRWLDRAMPDDDPRRELVAALRRDRFARMDGDGDGVVDKPEYVAAGDAQFDAADADGDGRLSPDEFRTGSVN